MMVYALRACLLAITLSGLVMTGGCSPITIVEQRAAIVIETLVAAAQVCGVVLSILEIRADHDLMAGQERTIRTARGELARSIRQQFAQWHLTPAEQDVGFLALKGLDVAEIADLRGSTPGTVRAQFARIYAKAGVSGRA
ncbi:helix-turn-helix transcriptional regulator [Allosediminivita pacifica]|uniref:HTH luxR-type domain-containing protein n=1 Tax=Allosediminivita pacifica TaxID=1267769 RepID=A0A2T6AYD6_9RHOB|nr:hypothetical protein [Allosediminivita pacifica]PTX48816.1 hypothetical protein C8N44_10894 [Allosediminivita pacifica]